MTDEEIRLECLRLAAARAPVGTMTLEETIETAKKLEAYVFAEEDDDAEEPITVTHAAQCFRSTQNLSEAYSELKRLVDSIIPEAYVEAWRNSGASETFSVGLSSFTVDKRTGRITDKTGDDPVMVYIGDDVIFADAACDIYQFSRASEPNSWDIPPERREVLDKLSQACAEQQAPEAGLNDAFNTIDAKWYVAPYPIGNGEPLEMTSDQTQEPEGPEAPPAAALRKTTWV